MIVAGVDLALNATGLVIAHAALVGEEQIFDVRLAELVRPGERRGMERIAWVMSRVRGLVLEHGVQDLAIEGYAFSKLTTHAHEQGELGGVVRLSLWQRGISWWEVTPATLKKIVTGKGNAPKGAMLVEVLDRWKWKTSDDNLADAYALARCVASHHLGFSRRVDAQAWEKAERVEGRKIATTEGAAA